MSTQVEYVIHQLFPAPAGLVVRYTLSWAERMRKEEAPAIEDFLGEPPPESFTLPVIAFATYDQITQRFNSDGSPWGMPHKVRGVEVLVYVAARAVELLWPQLEDYSVIGDRGAVLLRQFDQFWREPERRPPAAYHFDDLFLNGLPYSG